MGNTPIATPASDKTLVTLQRVLEGMAVGGLAAACTCLPLLLVPGLRPAAITGVFGGITAWSIGSAGADLIRVHFQTRV